ncbi:hypothetical protein ACFGOO_04365, partial [Treponema vincentii]
MTELSSRYHHISVSIKKGTKMCKGLDMPKYTLHNSQLHSFTASQLHSFTASQLHSFTASQLH